MSRPPDFRVSVYQNRYLPEGERVMDAVISVSTTGERRGPMPSAAQVIMIDCSGSMGGDKIFEAIRATTTAVDMLRDGVAFAIVAGTDTARMVYPTKRTMATASPATRSAAKAAVHRLDGIGGTAIGTWLELANTLLGKQQVEVKHAILLTDGHNEHQQPHELEATLRRCRDRFVCDTLGVGKGWSAAVLRDIADALHGGARGLPDARALSEVFRAMSQVFLNTSVANVALHVWHPRGAKIRFLKEVHPHAVELTGRPAAESDLVREYPIGSWGAETRDYHLSVELGQAYPLFEEVLTAWVKVMAGGQNLGEGLVPAYWTDDVALSTKIDERVAHYTGQVELDEVTQEGLAALRAGRDEEATAKLGRAVQLAAESEHHDTLRVLGNVVEVVDAATAKVRLRADMEQVDAEMAAVQTRTTIRWRDD
jgi:hypothetical protein